MARLAVLLRTIPTSSVGVPDVFSLKQTVLQRAHPQAASMAGAYSVLLRRPVSFSFAFAFLRSTNVLTSKISPRERERPILTLFHSHLRAKLYETATLMRPSTWVLFHDRSIVFFPRSGNPVPQSHHILLTGSSLSSRIPRMVVIPRSEAVPGEGQGTLCPLEHRWI